MTIAEAKVMMGLPAVHVPATEDPRFWCVHPRTVPGRFSGQVCDTCQKSKPYNWFVKDDSLIGFDTTCMQCRDRAYDEGDDDDLERVGAV